MGVIVRYAGRQRAALPQFLVLSALGLLCWLLFIALGWAAWWMVTKPTVGGGALLACLGSQAVSNPAMAMANSSRKTSKPLNELKKLWTSPLRTAISLHAYSLRPSCLLWGRGPLKVNDSDRHY